MRSEPPPSLPCATGSMPPATAAAAPPEEPPGVRSGSHGLRVGPVWRGSVVGRIPNSGMFVMPTITNPASCSRRTRYALWPGAVVAEELRAEVHRQPGDGRVGLDRDRDAGERPLVARLDRVGRRERAVGVDLDERVELGIALLDPLERRGHDLARAQLTAPHVGGELPDAHGHEVAHPRAPA